MKNRLGVSSQGSITLEGVRLRISMAGLLGLTVLVPLTVRAAAGSVVAWGEFSIDASPGPFTALDTFCGEYGLALEGGSPPSGCGQQLSH